jgi:anti-sigma factor RsiW
MYFKPAYTRVLAVTAAVRCSHALEICTMSRPTCTLCMYSLPSRAMRRTHRAVPMTHARCAAPAPQRSPLARPACTCPPWWPRRSGPAAAAPAPGPAAAQVHGTMSTTRLAVLTKAPQMGRRMARGHSQLIGTHTRNTLMQMGVQVTVNNQAKSVKWAARTSSALPAA